MMLREINTTQHPNDYFRRWFTDDLFDLFVWYDGDHRIVGFQLCYDKDRQECALTYLEGRGYSHSVVDSGEVSVWDTETPILREGGEFSGARVSGTFSARSEEIEPEVRQYAMRKLKASAQPLQAVQPSQLRACDNFSRGA